METRQIKIPFNKPSFAGKELLYIRQAVASGKISGDGIFSQKCCQLMENKFEAKKVMLTPSGTHALDMAALLLALGQGDEVIVPSFTFTSTVNSFVLRGAKPVFVDIRADTLNIDEKKIEEKITRKTRAVFCTHYAGVGCEMDTIMIIAHKHRLAVVEDAAQAVNATYNERFLGTIGDLAAYSFHETKNINCGEGGAIIIQNRSLGKRAEIIREKGTNRSQFFRGEVDKYTWVDIGSSYLLSEIAAAYLFAQLQKVDVITNRRKKLFNYYQKLLSPLAKRGALRFGAVPQNCTSNYHIIYALFDSSKLRDKVILGLRKKGILSVFHYLPLHTSPMGKRFGYHKGDLPITEDLSAKLLRLPMYNDLKISEVEYICKLLEKLV